VVLPLQQFVYLQRMYLVMLQSLVTAAAGGPAGAGCTAGEAVAVAPVEVR
jgi:hypothetical protein